MCQALKVGYCSTAATTPLASAWPSDSSLATTGLSSAKGIISARSDLESYDLNDPDIQSKLDDVRRKGLGNYLQCRPNMLLPKATASAMPSTPQEGRSGELTPRGSQAP